jgi:Putative zinc ribbon domain
MDRFCHSCTMPLTPDTTGPSANYCKHCTDEDGKLRPRNEVKQGIASWFQSWQGKISHQQALERAEHFMQAMPAWTDD